MTTDDGYEDMWTKFDEIVGLKYLKGMHLNDSKGMDKAMEYVAQPCLYSTSLLGRACSTHHSLRPLLVEY